MWAASVGLLPICGGPRPVGSRCSQALPMTSSTSLIRAAALCVPLLLGSSTAMAKGPDEAPGQTSSQARKRGPRADAPAKQKQKGKGKKQGKKKGKGKKKHAKAARNLCAKLVCTEDQAKQINTRLQSLRQQHRKARETRASLQTALSREVAKDKPSKKELARIQKELSRMQQRQSKASFDALMDVHAVLDPAQRKTLSGMVERQGLRRVLRAGHGKRPR